MFSIGQFTPSQFAAPAAPLTLYGVDNNYSYVRFLNNSPYKLSVLMDGVITIVGEFFDQYVEVKPWFSGNIGITPALAITSGSHSQANVLTIEGYYSSEVSSPQSQAIPQQAITATATGKPLFTATIGFGNTVTQEQALNVFCPVNSGAVYRFHSIKVETNDATFPTLNLGLQSGADNNFAIAVPAQSHTGAANPPVSTAHCTAVDSAAIAFPPVPVPTETLNCAANVANEISVFPDGYDLYPGNNLIAALTSGSTGKVNRLTAKWTEDLVVPPIPISGGVNVASSVVNDGNAAGATVLEATAQGDSPSDALIQNNGVSQFKGLMTLLAGLRATGASQLDLSGVTTDPVIKLPVGTLFKLNVFSGSATNAGVLQAHGLGVKPDFVMLQETNTAGDANTFSWDVAASDATNIKVWTNNATSRNYIALAIKI